MQERSDYPHELPEHPTVVDTRTHEVFGRPGDVIIIRGGNAWVVSAIIPMEHAIVTPAGKGSVSHEIQVEDNPKTSPYIESLKRANAALAGMFIAKAARKRLP
jgi:hypothetical protein